jgi:hypothetical protein
MKATQFIIIASLMTSCNTKQTASDSTKPTEAATANPSAMNCYSYASSSDTITLKLIHIGSSVTGTLVYSLKEKDKNKGTIQGNMQADLLTADYTFMSEGIQSIRKVAFKKEGNSFVEGYGDFNNIDSLKFNSSMKLVEVDCK